MDLTSRYKAYNVYGWVLEYHKNREPWVKAPCFKCVSSEVFRT